MITQSSPASRTAPDSAAPLSLADAQALACRFAVPVDACETVPLHDALDRVLAADVNAPFDIPAYDNSAMDGYAFDGSAVALAAAADIALTVAGTALAGHPFDGAVVPGTCIRIMTGAAMPAGCDTVILQERVRVDGDVIRFAAHEVARGANCRRAGEDLARGACALAAGRILRPSDLGLLASFGLREVTVRRRVRVAVFSTGDELREPGEPLGRGTLYDSNRGMLVAMLERLHIDALDLGIVRDDPAALERALHDAIAAQADAVITSGGVSVGEADFTRDVMARLGDVTFASLALRPGRPLACGTLARAGDGRVLFFGLPGNPVASAVTFYAIVRPALLTLAGAHTPPPTMYTARSTQALKKRPGRTEYLRAIATRAADGQWHVAPAGSQSSASLSGLAAANCFIVLGHDSAAVDAGAPVDILPLDGLI
ncbi:MULTISPECIES: gephyrin-like molybdotransferase Glp [unclassified Burkholderia]|uniref:molybdopterin molybdotransferase MoeA n=1 Tax=unclassified Burkholderia TaxID=2613784 RepID=UPI000F561559|nr:MULTISPECIES: gephyrin-like molybdotransferase Glp [unclassified Burkholderia]RQR41916.1 molybdopterin molybdenumtransferase MoeA [Burkholderia sp. Bp9131]RQR71461.1 molybdopterin molybdenumtransferase MoeA [Burkholderia sp. Bp9015]RQR94085.1 molybdopterin molybdenumtransferase MoeA [Burkholderia sp. Bp8994]RQS03658.1 molybdopterin molybdenumtransferase MoeA [Burkholderia sp. Bp8991]RQS27831.1 molybdopterin molybdenumtransferase MoeA [Burkholderia sp. Bp8995]